MKPRSLVRLTFMIAAAFLSMAGATSAADVRVMISAGFYGVYSELGPAFERASGHHLVTTRGPSMGDSPETIPARLARGEAADVVILDGGAADKLGERGLVRADSKTEFARSLIGMVVRLGDAKPDIGSVAALRSTLLAAKSIAYSDSGSGTYLSTVLFAKLGVADQIAGKSRKVRGPPSGEPVAAVAGLVGGPRGDTGLTDVGRDQVRRMAERLAASGELAGTAALYASTLPRARETAELLAPALGGIAVRVRHDLREHDPGELDGLSWAEAIAEHPLPDFDIEPDRPVAPGGESLTGFHERARAALADLAERHGAATVVVACHGGIVAAAVGLCFGLPTSKRVALPTRYASMTELELTDAGWRLGRYNDRFPLIEL